jgi:23S rRNA U2552 (ribose-2'-O)-methylase RlmE/FtsJ
MKKLIDIFENSISKSSMKWNHYFEIYERYFQKFIGTPVKILEIGVQDGGSLQMWKEYFGEQSTIVGIDIEEYRKYEEEQIFIEIGDQSNLVFLNDIIQKYGNFDIIIDDGSHSQLDILKSFSFLYPKLNNNGIYVVEDVHTSYWKDYGGGITSPFNFVSIASNFIHDTNVQHMKEPYTPHVPNLKSISFYDSMIVFEKEKNSKRYSVMLEKNEKN